MPKAPSPLFVSRKSDFRASSGHPWRIGHRGRRNYFFLFFFLFFFSRYCQKSNEKRRERHYKGSQVQKQSRSE
ncbi:hypothetical protein BDV39DRAFT_156653 [Aspergillus sergii]|uniref:Uncharacterized protein n=1 Tax=Aspergillus sergii TaxID=1034303 RepID=A0A5N6XEN3_9EURO|nr:hypothetical protein BDV39DRAFT_156653 [Aspergillus sergii]